MNQELLLADDEEQLLSKIFDSTSPKDVPFDLIKLSRWKNFHLSLRLKKELKRSPVHKDYESMNFSKPESFGFEMMDIRGNGSFGRHASIPLVSHDHKDIRKAIESFFMSKIIGEDRILGSKLPKEVLDAFYAKEEKSILFFLLDSRIIICTEPVYWSENVECVSFMPTNKPSIFTRDLILGGSRIHTPLIDVENFEHLTQSNIDLVFNGYTLEKTYMNSLSNKNFKPSLNTSRKAFRNLLTLFEREVSSEIRLLTRIRTSNMQENQRFPYGEFTYIMLLGNGNVVLCSYNGLIYGRAPEIMCKIFTNKTPNLIEVSQSEMDLFDRLFASALELKF